jgi:flavin-dependent dehydrogenase
MPDPAASSQPRLTRPHPSTSRSSPSTGPSASPLRLVNGSSVAVVGGGPAGSFFAYFLMRNARHMRLELQVDIYEQRDFRNLGAQGCNMCGGIVSESLVQHLAAEGIHLPVDVIRRRIDSYYLHMNGGSIRIDTPLREKRIAAVHRGGGPRGSRDASIASFDAYLLDLAVGLGARSIRDRVESVDRGGNGDGRPVIVTRGGRRETYDLMTVATGVNGPNSALFREGDLDYRAPGTSKTYICEFFLGVERMRRYLDSSMHVFLLNLPRLEFAALIPKGDYVTVCLLGQDIDKPLVQAFLDSSEVREVMPPHWQPPDDFCRCAPRINVSSAFRPYGDRLVFVGDCATSRLYKDGIGAAYRTAKAAAKAAALYGISRRDFERHYWPACRRITSDNAVGKVVFLVTRIIKRSTAAQRGVWRMLSHEQKMEGGRRRMSTVMWDTFTGSAPYKAVFRRTLHPGFWGRYLKETIAAALPRRGTGAGGRLKMVTGQLGRKYKPGEVVFRQGEVGDCMYVVHTGEVELILRRGEREFCLATLGQGEFFGEGALFREEPRVVTARSVGDSMILTLERESILRRMHEDPSLALKLLERMFERIRRLEEALVEKGSEVPVF